jgi:hypothetical protein
VPASTARSGGEPEQHSAAWWLDAVRREERRGELLSAFDLAERGLEEHPDDVALKHRAVLALARAGATEEATRRFDRYGLGDSSDEDVAALRARIAKDVALACEGAERRRLACAAAELYGAIYSRTGGYYPAINAATMWLIGGDRARARRLADIVVDALATRHERSYWAAATEAEAHLLRGEKTNAVRALELAATLHAQDYGALASTRRQLRMICEILEVNETLLSPLSCPGVVHFCGHRIGGREPARFPAAAEPAVATRIKEVVGLDMPGFAYGSLASGADILWVEALLAAGVEVHVVLPFARAEFIQISVAPSGRDWIERFDRCIEMAASVRFATDDAYLGDDVLFGYCSELAMGLALLRARYLDADVRQLAVWDREPAHGVAGTTIDVNTWRHRGGSVTVIRPTVDSPAAELIGPLEEATSARHEDGVGRRPVAQDAATRQPAPGQATPDQGRVVRAMLFADVSGFSVLNDEQLLCFAKRVLGAFAVVLERHRGHVCYRRTWGDAVFVVLTDAVAAALCALDLQDAMASVDLEAEGLPGHLALRLGAHVGPVFAYHDPILDGPDFTGSHISRTARIEPMTPPGAVYVTEPFAAALVLAGRGDLACDYVGHVPMAKNYGRLRMHRLRRVGSSTAALRTTPRATSATSHPRAVHAHADD